MVPSTNFEPLPLISRVQLEFLNRCFPSENSSMNGSAFAGKSKLRTLLGDHLIESLRGKTVIDFGCGPGSHTIELAELAERVIGLDIVPRHLEQARAQAEAAGVTNVEFRSSYEEGPVDAIVSLDAFEHFSDIPGILRIMHKLLKPGGIVAASFGPTWLHPLGAHSISVFPWAHLVFREDALMAWRARFRNDGAKRFEEVEGGLNQITIGRFEQMVDQSPFQLVFLEPVPIRKLRWLHSRWTREFTTAIVRLQLRA